MSVKRILTFLLLTISTLSFGQNSKFPPRDESGKTPDLKKFVQDSKLVGQLTYDIVTYDYEKSEGKWYYVQTGDKKISGYINSDFAYSPVDYRMFLTKEKGKWMISCIVAGD